MRLKGIDTVKPRHDLVVVDVQPREISGVYLGGNEQATKTQVEMYYGKVEKIGPEVLDPKHCPGLMVGDIAIFSQFAGSYIATSDDKLHKIIRGYDIMGITEDLNEINEVTLRPTADRVLVEVFHKELTDEGIYLNPEDAKDPRLQDISYGKILKLGPSVKTDLKVGDTVGYDPWVGEAIRKRTSDDRPELRIIRADDILFSY